ncbi:GNAT family N-acetyltransferase [Neofusicoccum parvum]|uniref:Putative gnat family n-acetyltransferase protein n=1 Tax=Botryosphaeria parva (strain UCR-NP2) TaxID=1287680 RepID=R1ELV1_BOTPV|nr:putative gnat family n-acetyltransferase protein [Neofusicoccum parvum UCRNP2]GME48395.1 GNAT family N-acetyltransferase [Neofusicoccum parvum]
MQPRQWQRQGGDQTFIVSTDPSLISHEFVQDSFAGPSMYWTGPLSQESLDTILQNSCFFGLFVQSSNPGQQETIDRSTLKQIGMARLVTDYATLAFLTDVFVSPEFQGKGLAKWMMRCVKELTDAMPEIRRVMFMAKRAPHAIKFYEDALGAEVHDQEKSHVVFMSTDNTPDVDI